MNKVLEKEKKVSTAEKRIDFACGKFKKINKSNCDKFSSLDLWLKKEATIFEKEVNYTPNRYMKYRKGTIVKINFGINIGKELSNVHFAIIMDNKDSIYKETVGVIPLTSKSGNNKIDLGTLVFDEFIKKLNKEVRKLDKSKNYEQDLKDLNELIIEYQKYCKFTFANVSQFRCISKNRIIYPKNKHDLIGKERVSTEILKKLEQELLNLYI